MQSLNLVNFCPKSWYLPWYCPFKCKVSLSIAHMVQFLGISLLMVFFFSFSRKARKTRVHPIGTFKTCEYWFWMGNFDTQKIYMHWPTNQRRVVAKQKLMSGTSSSPFAYACATCPTLNNTPFSPLFIQVYLPHRLSSIFTKNPDGSNDWMTMQTCYHLSFKNMHNEHGE